MSLFYLTWLAIVISYIGIVILFMQYLKTGDQVKEMKEQLDVMVDENDVNYVTALFNVLSSIQSWDDSSRESFLTYLDTIDFFEPDKIAKNKKEIREALNNIRNRLSIKKTEQAAG